MKKKRKSFCALVNGISAAGIAAVIALAVSSCATVKVLETKGSSFGIKTPKWVTEYVETSSNLAVEKLDAYKGLNCFVVEEYDENKDYAIMWIQNEANGARPVAGKISTTVSSDANALQTGEKGAGVEANQRRFAEAMSNANYAGLSKNGDWWQLERNSKTGKTDYHAFSLWVIDKKQLADQVATYIARFVNQNNAALSEAERQIYADLIAKVRATGSITN